MKHRTFEMLGVYAPKFDTLQWLTVTAKIELLLNIVWCVVVYCVQLPVCWIFCLRWPFQCFCLSVHPSHGLPVLIGLVSLESRSWFWISKSWIQVWSSRYHRYEMYFDMLRRGSRVWQTDGQTDRQTERPLAIARWLKTRLLICLRAKWPIHKAA